jgi:hypothetical protein
LKTHSADQLKSQAEAVNLFLTAHLEIVRGKILTEALESAQRENRHSVAPEDVAEAFKRFAPRRRIPIERGNLLKEFLSSISPITVLSVFLALVFGLLAWKGVSGTLDIAKIFAGNRWIERRHRCQSRSETSSLTIADLSRGLSTKLVPFKAGKS